MFNLFFFLLFATPIQAVDEFKVTQIINYNVDSSGSAKVSHDINLTNNISQIYAKEYQINLFNTSAENIKGHDKYGEILDSVITKDENTTVKVKFSQPTIGKDQTNQFNLNYNITEFAKKKGNTWEIQLPVFDKLSEDQQINLILTIPNSFGELSFSSAAIHSTHLINNYTQIQINQNQLNNKVLLIFGNHQLFDFKLKYYLKNDTQNEVQTKIPIPPETSSQSIILKEINPSPINISADLDGNWMATYLLKPLSDIEIQVSGQAKIHPPIKLAETADYQNLLKPQKYWPTTDQLVLDISSPLKNPKQIYQYVVNSLNYDYSSINTATRQGALAAIQNPNHAVCTEFTDLFVTIARANGIPAREIEGYAYSNNSKIKPTNPNTDVLHAWPEYFDKTNNRWLQVDPTWEKTTNGIDYFTDLDLNHLVFVKHGQSSQDPPPPGSYKKNPSDKSVDVSFATVSLQKNYVAPNLTLKNDKLIIKNLNLYKISKFNIQSNTLKWEHSVADMIPYSSTEVDIPRVPIWLSVLPSSKKINFTIVSDESPSPYYTSLPNPTHYLHLSIVLGATVLILCLGGIILTASKKRL